MAKTQTGASAAKPIIDKLKQDYISKLTKHAETHEKNNNKASVSK